MILVPIAMVMVNVVVMESKECKTPTHTLPWFSVQWHITDRCNRKCKHCYLLNTSDAYMPEITGELSRRECEKVIDTICDLCAEAGANPVFYITGGDPLARPDLHSILSYLYSRHIPVKLMGNPELLSEQLIIDLKRLRVRSYQVSMDGTEVTHDWFRGAGSFKETIRAIELLKKCNLRTVVMYTLSRLNSCDLVEVFELTCRLGVDVFAFARFAPPGHSEVGTTSMLRPLEYKAILDKMYSKEREMLYDGYETRLSKKDNLWKLYFYEKGELSLPAHSDHRIHSGCHIGQANLTILPDGTVYACRRFRSPVGKLPQQTALEVFTSDALHMYRDIGKLKKCSSCPLLNHCRGCPAVAFGVYGDSFAPDPQCWRGLESSEHVWMGS